MKDPTGGHERKDALTLVPIRPGLFEHPPHKGRPPALLGSRCQACGRKFFPRRTLCPSCFVVGQMEELRLGRQGVIYAATVVHMPSPAGIEAPYAYGYVELANSNLRVFALFSGSEPRFFTPGRKVELVIEPIRHDGRGSNIIAHKFKLAE